MIWYMWVCGCECARNTGQEVYVRVWGGRRKGGKQSMGGGEKRRRVKDKINKGKERVQEGPEKRERMSK